MDQTTGAEFERRVLETIEQLNYDVSIEPLERAQHGTLQNRISSWLMKPRHSMPRPDIMVEHGDKVVLVEVKAYPVLLGPVIQARHYADYFEAPAIICVPDEAFQQIPDSVREWAGANGVVLSPFGEIGDNLRMLLQEAETTQPVHRYP